MPAMAGGGGGRSLPPPPKPKAASTTTGSNPRGVAITGPRATPRAPTINDRQAAAQHGGSDVRSSGGDYGSGRANAYKATPGYHAAIGQVFAAQPLKQKAAIVRGAARNAQADPYTAKAVRDALNSLPIFEKTTLAKYLPHNAGIDPGQLLGNVAKDIYSLTDQHNPLAGAYKQQAPTAGKALATGLDKGLAGIEKLNTNATQGPAGPVSQAGFGGGTLGRIISHAPIDIARATLQDPSTLPKTAKGLAESTAGMAAGLVQLPVNAVTNGLGPTISNLGTQLASDYKRRYGSLAAGNDQAFINRIKKEGAAPEIFDAFGLAGGADATAGRAVADLAKTRAAMTGTENFLTRDRPNLLLSGSKTRPQQLGNTAGRIAAQRLEDRLRAVRTGLHPGELSPKERQVAPLFQSHAIRVTHSAIAQRGRRVIQETLRREVRGNKSAALTAIGKLNHWQKQAVFHAVHGLRVDTPAHLRADLADRRAAILADRQNPASLGNRIPAQHADKVDELQLIDRLTAHADQIAGPRMVAFQTGEAARNQRISALTNLHPATAEARVLRPVGDRLGIQHPDVTAAGQAKSVGGIGRAEVPRTDRLAQYVQQVRAAMKAKGLPEPAYFKHREFPETKFGDYTSGSGGKAMPADKRSSFALYRAGVADHSAQAYLDGLARSVKRPQQWRMTDAQFHAGALPTPSRAEIKAALGHQKAAHLLTGHELRRVLTHRGENMDNLTFYNPGRLAEHTLAEHGLLPKGKLLNAHEEQTSHELHDALNQQDIVQHGSKQPSEKFLTTPGWKAIPKTAFDEIQGGLKASSVGGRIVGKIQGTTAGLILAQNPHFLIMNTLAHAFPAIAGTKGAILPDLVKAPFWWHGLSDAEKDQIRQFEGGRGGHYNVTARLGSQAPNRIAEFGRSLDQKGLTQKIKAVNPLHWILRGEDIQSNYFRHAVMYHEMKRAAYQDMTTEFGHAVTSWERVKNIFNLGPKERLRAIANNMPKMEELGRTAVNILGDYGRFTSRERRFLNNRAVLFYSFLRHVTRTLLYVLPARHPLALAMVGELGNLHKEEVQKLLGGQDLPWAYGRIFFDNKGKLSSIDLTSTSPISSPLVDITAGGIKELPRLISPPLASLLDVAYGQTPTGAPIKQNAYSLASNLLSLSYPYRQLSAFHFGLHPQQSDSIPLIHERAQNFKTPASQQYQATKTAARGPLKNYLLASALGVYPKPDDSRIIAQHMAAKAGGGSGGYLLGGSSTGSGGGYLLSGQSGGGGGYLLP